MDRETGMFIRKDYSIIALAEAMKRGGDQRKAHLRPLYILIFIHLFSGIRHCFLLWQTRQPWILGVITDRTVTANLRQQLHPHPYHIH